MSDKPLRLGQRVKVVAKDVKGAVAYVGHPTFASGKWIGIILDEPKGKNNGTVRGHAYFTCEDNYGMFVRQTQIQLLDDDGNPMETSFTDDSKPPTRARLSSPEVRIVTVTMTDRRPALAPPETRSAPEPVKRVRRKTSPAQSKAGSLSMSSSRTSLAGSRQSLSGITYINSPTAERASTPDQASKRASFVETGFVETLNPQYTPGMSIQSPLSQPPPVQPTAEDKLAQIQNQQEMENLRQQVEDLTEKLETVRARRVEDREKLRELERLRMQLDQASEFKLKIMESQAQLQRDLQRARQETRDALEALQAHNDETAELSEATEMAALDREMAEERAETLQLELDQCREKLEEATLDLQLMRAEMEAGGGTVHPYAAQDPGAPLVGGYEMRQLEQQNARLRDTLVRLRDLSAHDKHHMQKMQKDLDQKKSEIAELSRTKEKLSIRVDELESQVADLQEQVDAALGAEEMVEQLGEKKMALEDEVEQLKQEVSELEALQEVHDQLVESNRELEMDLREELELSQAATREAVREREAALETVIDRDTTIQKFRELVQKQNEQCAELQSKQNENKNGSPSQPTSLPSDAASETAATPAQLEYRAAVCASRASTRAVDLRLRALHLEQAKSHAAMLAACLPDHFTQCAGDHDAVQLILLLQRANCKCDIVLEQIRERFPAVNSFDRDSVTKSHAAVQYSFRCLLQSQLTLLQGTLHQLEHALSRCPPELLLRAAATLPDMLTQERCLDALVELLRAGSLDENCSTEGVERCNSYLHTMRTALGLGAFADERRALLDTCAAIDAAAHALATDANVALAVMVPSDKEQDMGLLGQHILGASETLQQQLKLVRRRVPTDANITIIGLEADMCEHLRAVCSAQAWRAARAASLTARAACSAAAVAGERAEGAPLPHETLRALWAAASDRVYQQDDLGPAQSLKHSLSAVCSEVAKVAAFAQEREYDMLSMAKNQPEKVTPPIELRAQLVKRQLEETKTLTLRLESREADIRELRKALKAKQDEMSEMQIRKELAEKKLSSASRDSELQVEKLTRKLEDATNQLKRKEKEFEETMDHLQQDIDSLESERGALRDKLKLYAKRGGHATPTAQPAVPQPPPVPRYESTVTSGNVTSAAPMGAGEINEALQRQLKALSWAVTREREARAAAQRAADSAALRGMRPLYDRSAADERRRQLQYLEGQLNQLHYDWMMFVAKSGVCKFPDDISKYEKAMENHKLKQKQIRSQLVARLLDIQERIKDQLLLQRPWRCVEADFAKFATPELTKALDMTKNSVEVATIEFPVSPGSRQLPEGGDVYLTPTELTRLRQLVEELGNENVKLQFNPSFASEIMAS